MAAEKTTVLVTGSTGFIGSHLVQNIVSKDKYKIRYLNRQDGFDLSIPGWSFGRNIEKVDIIVHLAQSRYYREFPEYSKDIFQVNIGATFELLEWAREHQAKKFILASTGTVYKPSSERLNESSICKPATMYASSKLCAEHLVRSYSNYLQTTILRIFGTYGPGQRGMLIADMIRRIKAGEEIQLACGKGIYLTPIYVDDCVKSIIYFIENNLSNSLTVNVAGDEMLSLGEMVSLIERKLGRKAIIKNTDEPIKSLCADNSLLRTLYDRPMKSFSSGIEKTLSGNSI